MNGDISVMLTELASEVRAANKGRPLWPMADIKTLRLIDIMLATLACAPVSQVDRKTLELADIMIEEMQAEEVDASQENRMALSSKAVDRFQERTGALLSGQEAEEFFYALWPICGKIKGRSTGHSVN
jgi:hypothetical protein